MGSQVKIVGAGLAGSEAAWQLAQRGHDVLLMEMRPEVLSPAHHTGLAAEMVCSNSFKSDEPHCATGILKAELRRMDSMILQCAEEMRVPAGRSLAVDREGFSQAVTNKLRSHQRISWQTKLVQDVDPSIPTILATGPLTAEPLAQWITDTCNSNRLNFYDAIAPIVERNSILMERAYLASRYDKGDADFINCPLDRDQYERFVDALLAAPLAELHDFDTPYFEACLPIEVMAQRGRETLRHGPMKPVGLDDPRTGRWPYAVVQLRQDTLAGDHFNLVGFQTRLRWPAQQDVFRLIPALEHAEFVRYGSIHRNTYVRAPDVLDATLAVKHQAGLWIAGQLAGVEGYLESTAAGLAAALSVDRHLRGREPLPFPRETMLGSLLHYLANASGKEFAPVNAMSGLLPPLPEGTLDIRATKRAGGALAAKRAKGLAMRERSLGTLEGHLRNLGVYP